MTLANRYDERLRKKFNAKYSVNESTGCWEWNGVTLHYGYGGIYCCYRERMIYTHRLSWELHYGPIDGKFVLHKCDNPCCVNPEHLFLGSQKDNVDDMHAKGRGRPGNVKTHCIHGHEFTDENTYINATSGKRICRACNNVHQINSRKRRA